MPRAEWAPGTKDIAALHVSFIVYTKDALALDKLILLLQVRLAVLDKSNKWGL